MILRRLGWINKGQRGFTLIELLVALAITGLLASGITMTIFQVLSGNAQSSNQMNVVRQVQNAGYWISRDGQMAQSVELGVSSGFPLVLTWTEWDGTVNQVTYSITGDELRRSHSVDGGAAVETFVAQYIDSDAANTNCAFTGGVLTLKVTASVTGYRPASETRIYEVTPRPS